MLALCTTMHYDPPPLYLYIRVASCLSSLSFPLLPVPRSHICLSVDSSSPVGFSLLVSLICMTATLERRML